MKTSIQHLKAALSISLMTLISCFALTASAAQKSGGPADPCRITWEVAPEVSWIEYTEPSLMEETGVMLGINASLMYHGPLSNLPDDKESFMLRADARYSYGKVDYEGALWDGTPYQVQYIEDNILEFRGLFGYDFENKVGRTTPYLGVGYRYLCDDSSFDPYGYERVSNYVYVPLGFEVSFASTSAWSFGGTLEFDVLFWGKQRSYLGSPYSTVDNPQHEGTGFRASFRLHKTQPGADFGIEPFIRFWNVEDSEISEGFLEPNNRSAEIGLRLVWAFQ